MDGKITELGTFQTAGLVSIVLVVYAFGYLALPQETYLLASVLVCIAAASYLVVHVVFEDGLIPIRSHAKVPRWGVLAVGVIIVTTLVMAATSSFHLEKLAYVSLIVISGGFLVSVFIRTVTRSSSPVHYHLPFWYVGAVLVLVGTIGVSLSIVNLTLYETALLVSFFMVMFYLGFLVPVGIWEMGTSEFPDPESPVPEISVVIPAYNEEEWISTCIESVLATEYPDDKREIIVVDDATYDRAIQYSDRGVRVRQRPNGGRDAALNYGLHCSNGDIFVMVDADSILTENALKRIAGAFQSDPELGAVAGDVRVLNADRLLTRIQAVEYVFSIHTFRRACSFFRSVPICPGALSGFRREALESIQGFDPDTVTEDFDTTVQILKDGWTARQVGAVARTEAPFTLADLYTQRVRWYTGYLQCLVKHADVFESAESLYLHRLTFPALSLTALRPIFGIVPPALLLYGYLTPQLSIRFAGLVYFVFLIGTVVAIVFYALNESVRLLPWFFFLLIGYKQFIDFVFIRCILGYLFGADVEWGTIQREARPQTEPE